MTVENKNKQKTIIIFIVLTLIFIWGNSMMPAPISQAISRFAKEVVNFIISLFPGNGGFMSDALGGDGILRKIAHATEFACLGIEFSALTRVNKKVKPYNCLFWGAMVALFDETIQLFVPGRSSQVTDVWIDIGGFLLGFFISYAIGKRKKKQKASQ